MKTAIISCKTLEKELSFVLDELECEYPVCWLRSALHNTPSILHEELQKAIDNFSDYDQILLAMGCCGNSVVGLKSDHAKIILPKAEDCISLLCGSDSERYKYEKTYFFTDGWIHNERTIWNEYLYTLDKYGTDRGRLIFDTMLHNYKFCALLDTGCYNTRMASSEVKNISKVLGLEYKEVAGTLDYVRNLINGEWDPNKFLILPPGEVLDYRASKRTQTALYRKE